MHEIVVQIALSRRGHDIRDAGNTKLFLGAIDPPDEFDVRVGYDLGDFPGANVGGGDEEREIRMGDWGEEGAEDMRSNEGRLGEWRRGGELDDWHESDWSRNTRMGTSLRTGGIWVLCNGFIDGQLPVRSQ